MAEAWTVQRCRLAARVMSLSMVFRTPSGRKWGRDAQKAVDQIFGAGGVTLKDLDERAGKVDEEDMLEDFEDLLEALSSLAAFEDALEEDEVFEEGKAELATNDRTAAQVFDAREAETRVMLDAEGATRFGVFAQRGRSPVHGRHDGRQRGQGAAVPPHRRRPVPPPLTRHVAFPLAAAASSHPRIPRHLRQGGQDPDLERSQRLRANRNPEEEAGTASRSVHHPARARSHAIYTSAVASTAYGPVRDDFQAPRHSPDLPVRGLNGLGDASPSAAAAGPSPAEALPPPAWNSTLSRQLGRMGL